MTRDYDPNRQQDAAFANIFAPRVRAKVKPATDPAALAPQTSGPRTRASQPPAAVWRYTEAGEIPITGRPIVAETFGSHRKTGEKSVRRYRAVLTDLGEFCCTDGGDGGLILNGVWRWRYAGRGP